MQASRYSQLRLTDIMIDLLNVGSILVGTLEVKTGAYVFPFLLLRSILHVDIRCSTLDIDLVISIIFLL